MKKAPAPCARCGGAQFTPCAKCKGSGEDKSELSGVCVACGGPGRFPCPDCNPVIPKGKKGPGRRDLRMLD